MKYFKVLTLLIFITSSFILAQDDKPNPNDYMKDPDFQRTYTLWDSYYTTNDFETSLSYGWKIIHDYPGFTRNKLHRKMEEMLWAMHDSSATSEEQKTAIADTILFLYDDGAKYDTKRESYYIARKGYVLETWHQADPEQIIECYEKAMEVDKDLLPFYRDRLGLLYISNERKEDALTLYSRLAEEEPDNPMWNQRLENIAEDPKELMEILLTAWNLNRDNPEKAWKYASICLQQREYERAIEPLTFLIEKTPDVINYWQQLATAYDKLDKNDEAISAYKKLIELQPDNRDNYVNLAIIYFKKLDQLPVARSYLNKAADVSPDWDYPYYIEAQLYEQAGRNCANSPELDLVDKLVYRLASDTYKKAARKGGRYSASSLNRVKLLKNSTPTSSDYFMKQIKTGDVLKIEGKCYDWIGRSITVPDFKTLRE